MRLDRPVMDVTASRVHLISLWFRVSSLCGLACSGQRAGAELLFCLLVAGLCRAWLGMGENGFDSGALRGPEDLVGRVADDGQTQGHAESSGDCR